MAGVDAGVLVTCRGCGNTVLQKAMVPVLVTSGAAADPATAPDGAAAGGGTMGYLCVDCARLRIAIPAEEAGPANGAVAAS
jgi:DNA-directed RNA polymerase subunit RPC12/RpoP